MPELKWSRWWSLRLKKLTDGASAQRLTILCWPILNIKSPRPTAYTTCWARVSLGRPLLSLIRPAVSYGATSASTPATGWPRRRF